MFSLVSLLWTKPGIRSISSAINVASHLVIQVSMKEMESHFAVMTTSLPSLPSAEDVSNQSWIIILLHWDSTGTLNASSAM